MVESQKMANIPPLPLEKLLVDVFGEDLGARRVEACELYKIGMYGTEYPEAPNITLYGPHGERKAPSEEKFMIMAGDGEDDFPLFKRTFLSPEKFAIVYKAEKAPIASPLKSVNIGQGKRAYEEISIHYKIGESEQAQPSFCLLSLTIMMSQGIPVVNIYTPPLMHNFFERNPEISKTGYDHLVGMDSRNYKPQEMVNAILDLVK